MKCVICGVDEADCLDKAIYERKGVQAMVCTAHQPIAEIDPETGSLEHTEDLNLLRKALKMAWVSIDKPKGA